MAKKTKIKAGSEGKLVKLAKTIQRGAQKRRKFRKDMYGLKTERLKLKNEAHAKQGLGKTITKTAGRTVSELGGVAAVDSISAREAAKANKSDNTALMAWLEGINSNTSSGTNQKGNTTAIESSALGG